MADDQRRPSYRLWLLLGVGLIWTVLIRIPLILNAEDHLDSDLAVDGLTLLEATEGDWRWHYPGTPHIGTPAVLLSFVQAKAVGVNAAGLVSGGTIAACLIVIYTFLLNLRAFGPNVAGWGLIPSVFASAGTVWLSGRITGGHLLITAWFGLVLTLMVGCWKKAGLRRSLTLGLACGFGFYVDSMLAVFFIAMIVPCLMIWIISGCTKQGLLAGLLFLVGFAVGDVPRELAKRLDGYDSYVGQFDPLWDREVLLGHTKILFAECLPRLIGGHPMPSFTIEPPAEKLAGRVATLVPPPKFDILNAGTTIVALVIFCLSLGCLLNHVFKFRTNLGGAMIALTLFIVMIGVTLGFIINRNIFNSDNYRYLVFMLVPWSSGFGVFLNSLAKRKPTGFVAAASVALVFGLLMTVDLGRYYRHYGWIDARLLPTTASITDPAVGYFRSRPEATRIYGDYWDVYRLSFLTGGRLIPRPLGVYPDRYPEWRAKDSESDVYFVSRGGRVPSRDWEFVEKLPGLQIARWSLAKPPNHRQPWD